MGRRKQQSEFDQLFELLKITPYWVGPILALVAFLGLKFVLPHFLPQPQNPGDPVILWHSLVGMCSWLFPLAILIAWSGAEVWKLMNRNLLNRQTGLSSIKEISWQEFERLVGEAYRRKGYLAEVVGSDSGDGGVDIKLTGHGETVLVQCKQWKAYKVGVTTVRELLGVVISEKADRGIIVTSGRYTQEAQAFAQKNQQIELVAGSELARLIRDVQSGTSPTPFNNSISEPATPSCPLCGSKLVLRTARTGKYAGSQFWGCQRYPSCKGIKSV